MLGINIKLSLKERRSFKSYKSKSKSFPLTCTSTFTCFGKHFLLRLIQMNVQVALIIKGERIGKGDRQRDPILASKKIYCISFFFLLRVDNFIYQSLYPPLQNLDAIYNIIVNAIWHSPWSIHSLISSTYFALRGIILLE